MPTSFEDACGNIAFTFDAQLCIAGLLAYWLDPFYNFFVPMNLYSSNFVNVGSWCSYAPFVINKACSGSPEPILVIGSIYLVGFLVCAMLGGRILRLSKLGIRTLRRQRC